MEDLEDLEAVETEETEKTEKTRETRETRVAPGTTPRRSHLSSSQSFPQIWEKSVEKLGVFVENLWIIVDKLWQSTGVEAQNGSILSTAVSTPVEKSSLWKTLWMDFLVRKMCKNPQNLAY